LEEGLRSASDAFVLRRCQILLASSRGENAYRIARSLGCDPQTARTAIKRFNEGGIEEALRKRSSRPKRVHAAFEEGRAEQQLGEILHRSPREFGKDTSLWTLELAAKVSFEEGITEERVSAERLCGRPWSGWGCAGREPSAGSPAPTPSTREKKAPRPVDRPGSKRPGLGGRLRGRDVVEPLGPALALRLERGWQAPAPRATVAHQRRPQRSSTKAISCYGLYLPEFEEMW
jgi:transposase